MRRLSDEDVARVAAAVTARGPEPEPENWLERQVHRKILVHTIRDKSFEGILREECRDGVLLWNATLHAKPPIPLSGDTFVPRQEIAFVQTA